MNALQMVLVIMLVWNSIFLVACIGERNKLGVYGCLTALLSTIGWLITSFQVV